MSTRLLSRTEQCVVVETGHRTIMERQYYLVWAMGWPQTQLQIQFNEMEIYE